MTDDNKPDPKTERGRTAVSAQAGIGRGCPFCGRREKTIRDWHFVHIPSSNTTQVECRGCGARGPGYIRAANADDLVEALALWNERSGEGGSLQLNNLLQQRNSSTVQ